jgi:predicted AAA+ superfamily ATPase
LIIFDEIQECPKALTALKYFQEAETKYHLIAAGSLLGITLGQSRSFPVGKVEFLDLNPLTFEEFLLNTNDKLYKTYVHYLHEKTLSKIPNAFFEPLLNEFKTYLICGGMPEPASIFSDTKDIGKLQKVQDEILRSYQLDFSKHTSPINANRIQYVWNSITSQLSKENKKFIYKAVKKGARAREYEAAITWLQQAGIIHQIYNVSNPLLPLSAYRDLSAFKMYLLDVGLLMRMSKLNPSTLINGNDLFKEFKGSFAENYAAQSLLNALYSEASYWTSDRTAEVDFLIEHENQIIPIEVKSGKATRSRSLAEYNKKYKPQVRVRLSPLNIQTDGAFINIPIFYCDNIIEFINKM